MLQNTNGVSSSDHFIEAQELFDSAAQFRIGALCLVETKLNTRARDVVTTFTNKARRQWPGAKVAMSSSVYINNDNKQLPGGTTTIVTAPWANQTTTKAEENHLGRWTEAMISGRDNTKVTIITAYRVCKNSIRTCGPQTAFALQWHLLHKLGGKTHSIDPREEILADLQTRIQNLKLDGHEIILLMDANESLQTPNCRLSNWVRNNNLIDIHVMKHGTKDEPATFARGINPKRIDYILTTPSIAEYVTAAGILPIKEVCNGDHRALFADFDLKTFLRGEPSEESRAPRRGLTTNNPRAVLAYREFLKKELDTSNLESDANMINYAIKMEARTHEDIRKMMNKLDDDLTRTKLEADKKCEKINNTPWSPELMKAKRTKTFWQLWVSELKLNKDLSKKRKQAWAKGSTNTPSIKEAQKNLRLAQAEMRKTTKNAAKIREAHLEERAAMASMSGDMTKEQAINRIRKAEARQAIFNRLRRIMGKNNHGGVSHVLVEKASGEWEAVTEKDRINELLIDRNREHFSQADGTPFTIQPLRDLFGKYGTNEASDLLIKGELDVDSIEGISEATRSILKKMKERREIPPTEDIPNPATTISDTFKCQDLQQGYRKWRESTSTSPSGLHLGHEKALFKFESIPTAEREKDKNGIPIPRLSDRVLTMKALQLNRSVELGHVYPRWTKIVNTMIEKVPGKPMINKLRVIHLIESDFNFMIGSTWGRRLMWRAEDINALGEEQSGSRADRKATDVMLFKHIAYGIGRMTKTAIATFDNDAKSCFDRIVMTPAALSARRLGMTKKVCKVFLKTLEQAEYSIKTDFGTTDHGYSTSPEATIHGPGQGGKGSPAVWSVHSQRIL